MRKQKEFLFILFLLAFSVGGLEAHATPLNRPADWAKPMEVPGVPNFYQVSDALCRSARPLKHRAACGLGIKTVVDLCRTPSNHDEAGGDGIAYVRIPMIGWPLFPKEEQAVRFLRIVTDSPKTPILVHCRHGSDRTGCLCAVYRIAVQGWTKEKAVEEMIEGGFGFHGFPDGNVVQWINHVDIDRIRQKAGVEDNASN